MSNFFKVISVERYCSLKFVKIDVVTFAGNILVSRCGVWGLKESSVRALTIRLYNDAETVRIPPKIKTVSH